MQAIREHVIFNMQNGTYLLQRGWPEFGNPLQWVLPRPLQSVLHLLGSACGFCLQLGSPPVQIKQINLIHLSLLLPCHRLREGYLLHPCNWHQQLRSRNWSQLHTSAFSARDNSIAWDPILQLTWSLCNIILTTITAVSQLGIELQSIKH